VTAVNTIIEHDSQPVGRERIVMPTTGLVAELRVAAPAVESVQDTCALIASPSVGFARWAAMTDAGNVAFPGTPAWSPPI
jgi:hypothetical protein